MIVSGHIIVLALLVRCLWDDQILQGPAGMLQNIQGKEQHVGFHHQLYCALLVVVFPLIAVLLLFTMCSTCLVTVAQFAVHAAAPRVEVPVDGHGRRVVVSAGHLYDGLAGQTVRNMWHVLPAVVAMVEPPVIAPPPCVYLDLRGTALIHRAMA